MTLLGKEQLSRHSTNLRRGGVVAELWLEGNRLWLWRRTWKWMRPKKGKTIDSGLPDVESSKEI